jgi:hypothetical protein
VLWPTAGWTEWHIKPFYGITFGGDTTFVDLTRSERQSHRILGVTGALLWEVFGVEADLAYAPNMFGDEGLVIDSSVTTFSASLVVGLPRKWTRYTLRPYVVGGGGVMRVRTDDVLGVLPVRTTLKMVDVGGGATGFLTDRLGVNWELRYLRSLGGEPGTSFGDEDLSFYRATMALVIGLDRRFR